MQAWQWHIKKSNTLRVGFLIVGVAGFEPATSCSQSRRASRATLYPDFGLQMYKYYLIQHMNEKY